MHANTPSKPEVGGLARYFVEHREVGWMALVAVLIWGWFSYLRLAQQEDPRIPERKAVLVTRFPGASATKVEQLVTKKLEDKVSELESMEEITSQSRAGVSIIYVNQRPAPQARIDQEWDKVRAKVREATLPAGCEPPALDTGFGDTITLLFGIASPPVPDSELVARANLIRERRARLRAAADGSERASVFAFYPADVAASYRQSVASRFVQAVVAAGLATDVRSEIGLSFVMADFKTTASREKLGVFLRDFVRRLAGSDGELHPDFGEAVILMGNEDPLPTLRKNPLPLYSYRELEKVAEKFQDELKQLEGAGRVRILGNVPEMVYLLFSIPNLDGFKVSPDQVLKAIETRNAIIPGGTLRTEGQNFTVQLSGEFSSESELLDTMVATTREGLPIYARDLFEVRRGYENPVGYSVQVLDRKNAADSLKEMRSVLIGVEMKDGQIIGHFNDSVQATRKAFEQRLPEGMRVLTLSDQPKAVHDRITQFSKCFIEAVIVVVLVALFLMDWRSALVVAAAIPLTVAMTLGGMHLCGVPLHQISIAALIIALGMLVDDPVVASDGINRELAHGVGKIEASWLGPHKLRRAILFGTVINIVAFLPLVLLPGDKGVFIAALPMVVTLSLVASRIVSMTFVPLLGSYILRGQKGLEAGGEIRSFPLFAPVDRFIQALLPRYRTLLQNALEKPWKSIAIAYGLLLASFALTPLFGTQFFPPAERNQLLIDVELPESASISQTRDVLRNLTAILREQKEIATAAIFAGGSAPRFYYNVAPREPGHYIAQVLVNTWRADEVPPLLVRLRDKLDHEIAGARCVVKQLEQGPPVDAPIQIRLAGEHLDILRAKADEAANALRQAGAYKVHDDLGRRIPALQIDIDQQLANSLEIDNEQIGRIAQAAFAGLTVTELREGDHLIPVSVRLRVEERNEAEQIRSLHVRSHRGQLVPLDAFANLSVKPEFATIGHFNKLRTVTVKAYAPFGQLPSSLLKRANPALASIALPPGYRSEFGGEAKELAKSQSEMGTVMFISISLIALALVIQFASAGKALVVLLTVPLGLIGAFTGLALTQAAMGFMALLGIVSLAGVIVSHIIVLSDFIEEARAEGVELKQALLQAGLVRLRAVLVTVLATVGGLIPLALTGGALWHPLTAVHIFGLLFATVLTLVLLPVLYYLFCAKLRLIK